MANHTRYHRRSTSVPQTRLLQSLPPVPLPQISIPPPQIYLDNPESDDEEEEEEEERIGNDMRMDPTNSSPSDPPQYQPMYDYLRSKQITSTHPPAYGTSPSSSTLQIVPEVAPTLEEPYRDEPFVVNIDSSPPPPSYYEIYRQHEIEMDNLQRSLTSESDQDPAEHVEDIYKWIVAMLLITLTVACIGTAFNWGGQV